MANTISNNRTSYLVSSHVPFFVRNDHPNFVKFLEAYHEFLEQDNGVSNRTKNLLNYQNIDITEDMFAEKLYDIFMALMPKTILADKTIILKNIKDFYRAKGTEKSVKFLFNILYATTKVSFYYPKKDIIRASDGKWYVEKSIRIQNTSIDNVRSTSLATLEKFINTQIRGNTSNATAIVERVDRFFEQGTQVDELLLSNIDGTFRGGETIFTTFQDTEVVRALTSNIYSGIINTITINDVGSNYQVGDPVIMLSNTGSGACAFVAQVTTGNLRSISVLYGGSGYQANNLIIATGGGGTGANASVLAVNDSGTVHPNSYNIVSSTISLEANTPMGNAVYSNLNSANANTAMGEAFSYWTYANTGPIITIQMHSSGSGYSGPPTLSAVGNTEILKLGILGSMSIVSGGEGYVIGDKIEFINNHGSYGVGASGNVKNVNDSGSITEVEFEAVPGHIIGGSGYDPINLPTANVITSTGTNANVIVTSTLGSGVEFVSITSSIGAIERILITNRGSGYLTPPTIDLTGSGDGTANANATILTGSFSYPGRYLNDDGHLSSYNFIQDRDYYQIFSYVIKSKVPIAKYRKILEGLTHPVGTKLFGQLQYENIVNEVAVCSTTNIRKSLMTLQNYVKTGNTINIDYPGHTISANMNVALEFVSGGYNNVKNGIYTVYSTDSFVYIRQKSAIGNVYIDNAGLGYASNGYLTIDGDGKGANVSYTINANGAIVSVVLNEPGIGFTQSPTLTANASNTHPASFSAVLQYANNTTGQVYISIR